MIGRRVLIGWINDDHNDPHNVLMVESPEGHPGWLSFRDIFKGAKRGERVSIFIETLCDECGTRALSNKVAQINCGNDCHVPDEEPVVIPGEAVAILTTMSDEQIKAYMARRKLRGVPKGWDPMNSDNYGKLCCESLEMCLDYPCPDNQGLVEVDSRPLGGQNVLRYRHPMAGPFTLHSTHDVRYCPFCGSNVQPEPTDCRADWRDLPLC